METKPRSENDQRAINRSLFIISSIDELNKNEDFKGFMARSKEMSDALADEVLHDDTLSDKEREAKRNRRLGVLDVLRSHAEERESHFRYLASQGVVPGDIRQTS